MKFLVGRAGVIGPFFVAQLPIFSIRDGLHPPSFFCRVSAHRPGAGSPGDGRESLRARGDCGDQGPTPRAAVAALRWRVTEAQWIDAFCSRMSALGVRVEPTYIADMARELYPTQGHLPPGDVAQAEWDSWPPNDD